MFVVTFCWQISFFIWGLLFKCAFEAVALSYLYFEDHFHTIHFTFWYSNCFRGIFYFLFWNKDSTICRKENEKMLHNYLHVINHGLLFKITRLFLLFEDCSINIGYLIENVEQTQLFLDVKRLYVFFFNQLEILFLMYLMSLL